MVLHNPNNWHWVDKNCIYWTREYFAQQLTGLHAENEGTEVKTVEVKSVDGDVEVCQRKGKVISLFDVSIELSYKGKLPESEESVTGRIKIPECAYDTEKDEYQFVITIDNDSASKSPVKALVRSKIVPQLRERLAQFGPDLIKTHGNDIQHSPSEAAKLASAATEKKGLSQAQTEKEKKVVGQSTYNTTTLTLKPVFSASAEELYNVFLNPQMVSAWTRGPAQVEPKEGGQYSLFGGNITGKFLKLEPHNKISMTWRLRDWKPNHYAQLSYDFSQGSGETTLNVNWEGIPVGQEEIVQSNFQEYYIRPIMMTFGYGIPSDAL